MIKNQINTSELIAENQRYVELVAKQYLDQGLTLEQLIEAGNRGLAEAAKRFDSSKGHSFMSYAVWWVRQSILQALAQRMGTHRKKGTTNLQSKHFKDNK